MRARAEAMSFDVYQAANAPNRPVDGETYDVFISYTSEDREMVQRIAEALRNEELNVWFDKWNLVPGREWQTALEHGIRHSRSVAVFLGPNGLGAWAGSELSMAFNLAVTEKIPVIPVLLAGVSAGDDRIPMRLRTLQSCPMASDLDQASLDSLMWGITGVNPYKWRLKKRGLVQQAPRNEADPNAVAAQKVADRLRTSNVTFFVGRSTTHPQSMGEIPSRLLAKLGLVSSDPKSILPSADLAASYFAAKHNDDDLENYVIDILSGRDVEKSAGYSALAGLQQVLAGRTKTRGRREHKRLIVSSNLDLLLEKALLKKGIPFTRIVQYRMSNKAQINTIATVSSMTDGQLSLSGPDGHSGSCDPRDDAALGFLIAECGPRSVAISNGTMYEERGGERTILSVNEMIEPIIYKLHGSQDVPESCTLSTEHYFDILCRSMDQKCIPTDLTTIISDTPLVLVGSHILDADFRLTYALLRVSLEAGKDKFRYAVVSRDTGDDRDGPYKLACGAWGELKVVALKKYGIEMLDQHGDLFFEQVKDAFNARP
jgi:TIR domain/SIR2-like domain